MNENQFYEELLELDQIAVDSVEKTSQSIVLHYHQTSGSEICSNCLESTCQVHQYTTREVRDLNILGKEVWLHLRVKH